MELLSIVKRNNSSRKLIQEEALSNVWISLRGEIKVIEK